MKVIQSFSFQEIWDWGILLGVCFQVIHEAARGCNRGATAPPELSHPQGCKTERRPEAPFS